MYLPCIKFSYTYLSKAKSRANFSPSTPRAQLNENGKMTDTTDQLAFNCFVDLINLIL